MAESSYDLSLFENDPLFYEYIPGYWVSGLLFPQGAIDAAKVAEFKESDIFTATFAKTGKNNIQISLKGTFNIT